MDHSPLPSGPLWTSRTTPTGDLTLNAKEWSASPSNPFEKSKIGHLEPIAWRWQIPRPALCSRMTDLVATLWRSVWGMIGARQALLNPGAPSPSDARLYGGRMQGQGCPRRRSAKSSSRRYGSAPGLRALYRCTRSLRMDGRGQRLVTCPAVTSALSLAMASSTTSASARAWSVSAIQ